MTKMKIATSNLKEEALLMKIPIITDEGLFFLIETIKKHQVKTILEIGSAIGYSAIMMAAHVEKIVTVEREEELANIARENIKEINLASKVTVINADALNLEITETFDLIFIDAAKAQYEKFFIKFKNNLTKDGIIICDNLNFHNLDYQKASKSTQNLLKKLANFKKFLKTNNEFETTFTQIGDGMSLSRKRK